MRYLSVCSGIEAASVAWHPLGWQCAGLSEIEPFPRAVLEQRFGAQPVNDDHRYSPQSNVLPLFGDFTKIEAHHVGPIDLLVGGTPCQSFSIAGKRLGLDDPRGNLTLEFLALARRVRPRWIVWENVPGILSDDGGKTMGTFLWLLGELGYRWAYRVLDAQFIGVDGFERAVPQRRRRVFVVGHLGDDTRAATVLFERESLRGHPAPRREAGQSPAPTLSARTKGGGGLGTDFDCDGGLVCADVAPTLNAAFGDKQGLEDQHINGGGDCSFPRVSLCLNAGAMGRQDAETETLIPTIGGVFDEVRAYQTSGNCGAWETGPITGALDTNTDPNSHVVCIQERAVSENPDNGPQGSGIRTDGAAYTLEARHHVQAVAFDTTQITSAANYSNPKSGDPCHPLAAGAHPPAIVQPFVLMERGRAGGSNLEYRQDGTANAILTPNGGRGGFGVGAIAESWAVRRLTPMECERLQGFPDGHTAIQWRGKDAADGPRYKAIGNSMACNVMRWIGERIAYVEAATQPCAILALLANGGR